MFWGIDRDAWISIWAGGLGAIPAAVISAGVAAWVAVRVLNRSNLHQRQLADKAAREQRTLARRQANAERVSAQRALREQRAQLQKQLSEQRILADRQLTEQRRLAERQIAEQRKEASVAREQQAIAEVIIATEDFMAVEIASDELAANQLREVRVAIARWRAELGADEMQGELLLWARLFGRASDALRTHVRAGREESGRLAGHALRDVMAAMTGTALSWQAADSSTREFLCQHLVKTRAEIESTLGSLESTEGAVL